MVNFSSIQERISKKISFFFTDEFKLYRNSYIKDENGLEKQVVNLAYNWQKCYFSKSSINNSTTSYQDKIDLNNDIRDKVEKQGRLFCSKDLQLLAGDIYYIKMFHSNIIEKYQGGAPVIYPTHIEVNLRYIGREENLNG